MLKENYFLQINNKQNIVVFFNLINFQPIESIGGNFKKEKQGEHVADEVHKEIFFN